MLLDARQRVLNAHLDAHPERFARGPPKVPRPPVEVWINRPTEKHLQIINVEDETSSSASKVQNQATEARPSAAGPPAQGRAAPAEGVAAMAEPTGRAPPGTTGAR